MLGDYDTILTVPNRHGAAAFFIRLKLDVQDPDLSGLDELLAESALDHLEYVVWQVEQPYPWAAGRRVAVPTCMDARLDRINGELWRARASDNFPLVPGDHVRVEEIDDDLRLVVGSLSSPTQEEQS